MKHVRIFLTLLVIGIIAIPSSISAVPWSSNLNFSTNFSASSPTEITEKLAGIRSQQLAELQHPTPSSSEAGIYHTYQEMTVLLQNLAQNHSDIMSLTSTGTTYEGRDLWMVKLSDNVAQDEDEPEVLFTGAHHGNEKPSYEVLIYFIQYLVDNHENNTEQVRRIINNTEIYIVPMVNPDGVEANTRKNKEPNHGFFGLKKEETSIGVDLNRNYGYRWMLLFLLPRLYLGSTDYRDSSNTYRGERPFSEVEIQAIKTIVESHNIKMSISYHTFGELVLYPWGYSTLPPEDKPVFVSIGENITRINNYTLAQSIELYPTLGDACDWMYGRHGIFAYTIELGQTYAPGSPEVLQELCATHARVNLYMCERAGSME